MEPEKTLKSQNNLEKENQSWRHHNPRVQDVLKNCNHQDSVVLAQKQTRRSMKQRKNPEMGPQPYGQLVFDKSGRNTQRKKDSLFNKWCWENWTVTCGRMKLDHILNHTQKQIQWNTTWQ